jgi:hypothetical protein
MIGNDTELDQYVLGLKITHAEAGVLYAVLHTWLDVTKEDAATVEAIIEKLKRAQLMAIAEGVTTTSLASGRPQ